jgi:sortase A
MFPKGTIYNAKKDKTHGEIVLTLSKSSLFFYTLIRGVGAGLIAFSVLTFLFTFGPIAKEEFSYSLKKEVKEEQDLTTESYVDMASADKVIAVQKEAQNLGVDSYFSVVIPKIEAASNVIANVDTGNEKEYLSALKEGIAHAKGTYFPGQGRNIFLFAHSTDTDYNVVTYNAVFYLLRKLEPGDKVIVFFADDKYVYEVVDKVVVDADDTSYITRDYPDERLILQTCDPPGTNWKRLFVIAKISEG